jgi:hypothetical protein
VPKSQSDEDRAPAGKEDLVKRKEDSVREDVGKGHAVSSRVCSSSPTRPVSRDWTMAVTTQEDSERPRSFRCPRVSPPILRQNPSPPSVARNRTTCSSARTVLGISRSVLADWAVMVAFRTPSRQVVKGRPVAESQELEDPEDLEDREDWEEEAAAAKSLGHLVVDAEGGIRFAEPFFRVSTPHHWTPRRTG